jgi:SpoVK/Ycf46/Vps4 family AAA+-type ATPase
MRRLDELTGLEQVKTEVKQLTNFIEIQRKRKERGLKVAPITYHCVFTGNPGTGKTTVARILADIFRELGVVKKGHLVETDRSGLVAEYVGQTAVKTNKVIDTALDGVLFIDEAYTLVQGGDRDYGGEAIATLLKRMEDDRGRLVVVLAGYTEEMKKFINSNPGLQSRFSRYIEFPDYTAKELAEIFLMNAEANQYTCDKDVRASIVNVMEVAVRNKDVNFGNARYVRNLFEKAIQRQAVRLSTVAPITTEMLSELTLHDLGFAYED